MLTQSRLKELLSYDPETGVFTRASATGTAKIGDVAGTVRPDGYIAISVDGRQYLAHRLAWFYQTGEWPKHHTDHRDGNHANNRFANLRTASAAQNGRNRCRPNADNTSGVRGVYWSKRRRKWVAQIGVGRTVRNLGGFADLDAARAARAEAEARFYGEFA